MLARSKYTTRMTASERMERTVVLRRSTLMNLGSTRWIPAFSKFFGRSDSGFGKALASRGEGSFAFSSPCAGREFCLLVWALRTSISRLRREISFSWRVFWVTTNNTSSVFGFVGPNY